MLISKLERAPCASSGVLGLLPADRPFSSWPTHCEAVNGVRQLCKVHATKPAYVLKAGLTWPSSSRMHTCTRSGKGLASASLTLAAMKLRMLDVDPTTPASRCLASMANANISPGTCEPAWHQQSAASRGQ